MRIRNDTFNYTLVMFIFAIIFALVSFVNHYLFRTYSLDLGLYNQALYDYAHGRFNYSTLLEPDFHNRNQLADHFDLVLIIFAPLSYIFGSYTLLIVQWLAILCGGFGIAYAIKTFTDNRWLPLIAMIHFYSMWGIYAALAFDYHSNVIAAMLVPWLFYFLQRDQKKPALIIFLMILVCKENMALWAVFLASGFAFFYDKDRGKRKFCLQLMLLAVIYFIVVMKYFMPAFSLNNQAYIHFDFKVLGADYKECFRTIFFHPLYTARLLYKSPYNIVHTYLIKKELHQFILLSGGLILFIKPSFLWMLIPIYGQKLFNDDYTKWGINHQYSIEFAPIITLALFVWFSQTKYKYKVHLSLIIVLITILITIKGMHNRNSKWYSKKNECVYSSIHYKRDLDIKRINHFIKQVPSDLSMSVSCSIAPHVAFRKEVYQYPYVNHAQMILLLNEPESLYPLTVSEFKISLDRLLNDTSYVLKVSENPFYMFVRKDISFSVQD